MIEIGLDPEELSTAEKEQIGLTQVEIDFLARKKPKKILSKRQNEP